MCFNGGENPAKPGDGGAVTPCPKVKGKPTAVGPTKNSIVCKGGTLVIQNNNTGVERDCTEAHEGSHARDWKERYGEDLCVGVDDGKLPVGGDGYKEFLRQSECKAYQVGIECRQNAMKTASDTDKAAIQKKIDRDKAQLEKNKCE